MAANATCLCVVWPVLNYLSSLSKHPQVQVSSSILWVFLSYLLTKVRLIFARGYLKCHPGSRLYLEQTRQTFPARVEKKEEENDIQDHLKLPLHYSGLLFKED